mgnify:CR=1 FL=1
MQEIIIITVLEAAYNKSLVLLQRILYHSMICQPADANTLIGQSELSGRTSRQKG